MDDISLNLSKGIKFKHFQIENGRTFEKVNIPLENQGVVLIQGNNGVGKSSLWDLFEAVLYGSTPTEHKKDELTKNDDDATYTVSFEKNDDLYNISLKRRKGKWSYNIQKNNTQITEHSYTDAVKSISKIVGLTKAEFEGSVHLTQDAQHILIKSELSERKKYISNFFGIDDRYDQIHLAAKQEGEKIADTINKLSGLSHSKQMLETELTNLETKNVEELEAKIGTLKKHAESNTSLLNELDSDLRKWEKFTQYEEAANFSSDPEEQIKDLEKAIIETKTKLRQIEGIKNRNQQANKVNSAIDDLEKNKNVALEEYPNLLEDHLLINDYEKELQQLVSIKNQNDTVHNLRGEIKTLPTVEEIPVKKLEEQLLSLQIEYQTHAKSKIAKEKGICSECGSQFTIQDVQKEIELISELREAIDDLTEDYTVVKDRNTKVKRRKLLEEYLAKVPKFSKENRDRISFLEKYIPVKKEYAEIVSSLNILSRMEILEEVDPSNIPIIEKQMTQDKELIERLKQCQIAKSLIPSKPSRSKEELLKQKSSLHNEILNLQTQIQKETQMLGEYKNINETATRLSTQLTEINKKLGKLDELKKEEFFWGKLTDAYGVKGLRIQQLEKMVDLIIKQLPVYCSVLFKEKRLTFKHKVDANNVKILACREEIDGTTNKIKNKFQHDISSFSGGEKDLMSVSFILTLADCVPHSKKADMLILDEVDAQLDEGGKFRFINQLLPMLKKKHGTIFVISHNKEVQLANIYDQVWEIQKTNHVSTIKMTHVNQYT